MINEPFSLKILDLNNNSHIVNCIGYQHTIKYIKYILSSDMNLFSDQIDLYIGDKKLINELKLEDYKINKDTKIKMFFLIRSGLR